ncbi:protein PAXX isoform X2 [Phalacrocorax aristotelis]|uniref:protein PAXX isoform X2 n=1 Tax=Phalacrocorax aristotelis TaxID=126867 RepID=UPI003F4BCBF5
MAEPAGPFYLLRAGPGRYLCWCRPGPGGTVYVTDALEVWAAELGASRPLGCRWQPEEYGTKLREALGRGAASLHLGEGKATLQLREEAPCWSLDLFKLPIAEARSQLQALVFGMAGHIESLERRLGVVETLAPSCSPEKNAAWSQQLFLPGGQLPGSTSPGPAICLPFLPQEAAGPVTVSSATLSVLSVVATVGCPAVQVPFLAWKGLGLSLVAHRCLGCTLLRLDARHRQTGCLLASRRRSGLAALPNWGLWQVHAFLLLWERRPGLALPPPPRVLGQPGWAAGSPPWAWRGL